MKTAAFTPVYAAANQSGLNQGPKGGIQSVYCLIWGVVIRPTFATISLL